MKYIVEVTQSDIDRGCRCSSMSCPVARALGRQIPGVSYVIVGCTGATVRLLSGDRRIRLPEEVRAFIKTFDHSFEEVVKPFTFELEIPDEDQD